MPSPLSDLPMTVLVISNDCEKQIHPALPGVAPDVAGRRYCLPHNWLVCVRRGLTPLVQFERVPGYPVRWRRVAPAPPTPLRPRTHP